ncbi:MAG TPA: chromate transporter [Candidatus Elarobacter sp.]|jgi:chromate transporter
MSTGDGAPAPPDRPHPSLLAIAGVFGYISATSFGGGQTAAIRREVVRKRKWLSESEFLELLSIAQILPGANPPSVAVMIGSRLRGAPGAIAGLGASVIPGFVILMAIALVALNVHAPALTGALRGCAAVAVGLTCANAIEMTMPRLRSVIEVTIVVVVALFVLVLHASLWLTLAIFLPIALVATRKAAA